MSRPVLLVTYGNGHLAKVAPVIRSLNAQGVPTHLLALTLGLNQAQRMGLVATSYRDWTHLIDWPRARALGEQLAADNAHPDVAADESVAYLGINMLEWVESMGEDAAWARYREHGRRGFKPMRFMSRLVDALDPKLIISTASPRSEQAAIEVGVARGTPTLTMMDLFALPHDNFRRNTVFADRITVLSPMARDNLIEAGLPSEKLYVTGCPAYDPWTTPDPDDLGQKWRAQMGWQDCHVVMWAGNLEEPAANVPLQWLGNGLGREVEQRLRAWVAQSANRALVVRYHPNQFHLFEDLGVQERVWVSDPRRDALEPQLRGCDTLITQTSTVGFEAALLGKRVLALSFSPWVINFDFDYGRLGLGESVASLDEITPVLDRKRADLYNSKAFPPPGAATPRVVAQIASML